MTEDLQIEWPFWKVVLDMKYFPEQANNLGLDELFNLYSMLEMKDDYRMAMEKYIEATTKK